MATEPTVFCYADAVDRLMVYMGGAAQDVEQQRVRLPCQDAYRDMQNNGPWQYLYTDFNLNFDAPQNTGTVTYTNSNLQLTLSGATWPSWVTYGRVRINGINYQIDGSVSATVVTLSTRTNPGADISTPTAYTLFQSIYSLPADFAMLNEPTTYSTWASSYVSMRDWQWLEWHGNVAGPPVRWTIGPDPHLQSGYAIYLQPYPNDTTSPFVFTYQKLPRRIRYTGYEAQCRGGTLTVSAGSTAVTGSATTFDATMVGSMLRLSQNASVPTGLGDLNPYLEQRRIASVADTTHLTLDYAVDNAYSAAGFVITDPIDLPDMLMNAYIQGCIAHFAKYARLDQKDAEWGYYRKELIKAREQDSALAQVARVIGGENKWYDRGWLLPLAGAGQP